MAVYVVLMVGIWDLRADVIGTSVLFYTVLGLRGAEFLGHYVASD